MSAAHWVGGQLTALGAPPAMALLRGRREVASSTTIADGAQGEGSALPGGGGRPLWGCCREKPRTRPQGARGVLSRGRSCSADLGQARGLAEGGAVGGGGAPLLPGRQVGCAFPGRLLCVQSWMSFRQCMLKEVVVFGNLYCAYSESGFFPSCQVYYFL